jgi:hypothetical protein
VLFHDKDEICVLHVRAAGMLKGHEAHWTDGEIYEGSFKDARLERRFADLMRQIGDGLSESICFLPNEPGTASEALGELGLVACTT